MKTTETVNSNSAPTKAFGTREWAATNVNIQTGCEHGCLYCYAQCMSVRFGRTTGVTWMKPRLRRSMIEKAYRKREGTIMFPTTHDITEENLDVCLGVLKKMLASGNDVLVVSKPHLKCVQRLCEELQDFKGQILFRFTIGSADDRVLSFWEPYAPHYQERLASLKWAWQLGFKTSVSCEPMLDGNIQKVVEDTKPFVTDAIWLGRVNNIRAILAFNAPWNFHAYKDAGELLALQTDQWVFALYEKYKDDPVIKFKDSIKRWWESNDQLKRAWMSEPVGGCAGGEVKKPDVNWYQGDGKPSQFFGGSYTLQRENENAFQQSG